MIISHQHKFIFFSAGKTGTTSMEHCLAQYDESPTVDPAEAELYSKHMPPALFKPRLSEAAWNAYFKFAFVRNPWDWVISAHFFAGKNPNQASKITSKDIHQLVKDLPMRGITWAPHRTQHAFLSDPQGKLSVDFVGKFECLQEDFDRACDRIEIPRAKLPTLNTTPHRHYSGYYDEETQRLVGELFRIDAEMFNYQFSDTGKLERFRLIPNTLLSLRLRPWRAGAAEAPAGQATAQSGT